MKLLVSYSSGKTYTHIGVEKVEPIKNANGGTEAILAEGFNWVSRLSFHEQGARYQITKIEIVP